MSADPLEEVGNCIREREREREREEERKSIFVAHLSPLVHWKR